MLTPSQQHAVTTSLNALSTGGMNAFASLMADDIRWHQARPQSVFRHASGQGKCAAHDWRPHQTQRRHPATVAQRRGDGQRRPHRLPVPSGGQEPATKASTSRACCCWKCATANSARFGCLQKTKRRATISSAKRPARQPPRAAVFIYK